MQIKGTAMPGRLRPARRAVTALAARPQQPAACYRGRPYLAVVFATHMPRSYTLIPSEHNLARSGDAIYPKGTLRPLS
jgi:hypothetical protein